MYATSTIQLQKAKFIHIYTTFAVLHHYQSQMYQYQFYIIKLSFTAIFIFYMCNCFAQLNTGSIVNDSNVSTSNDPALLFEECFTSGLNKANKFDLQKYSAEFFIGLDELINKEKFSSLKSINTINNFLTEKYFAKAVSTAIPQDALLGARFNNISAAMLQSLALNYVGLNYIIRDTKTGIRTNIIFKGDTLLLDEQVANASDNILTRRFNDFKIILFRNNRLSKANVNDDAFIDENFLIDTLIQIHQLPALQYFNNGVVLFNAEQYSKALQQLEKAQKLYAAPYIEQWIKLVLGIALSDEKAEEDPTAECDFLLKFSDVNWDVDNIQQEVINVAITQAQQLANQPQKVQSFLTCIDDGIDNEDLKNELNEKINLVLAESYYSNAQYQYAINNFKKLYKRDTTKNHTYIKNSVIQSLYSFSEDSLRIDSLLKYEQSFSFLKDDAELINYKTYLLTTCIYNNFENKNEVAGLSCLDKFKTAFPNNENKLLNSQQISAAYASAAQYFINKQNFEKAKSLIDDGKMYCGEVDTFTKLLETIENNKRK